MSEPTLTPTPTSTPAPRQFAVSSTLLHWLMVVMIFTMLFIGAAMVGSLAHYHLLLSIHRPLGIAVLIVAIARLINRHFFPPPPFPATVRPPEQRIAIASERLMYTLMIVLPLVGWSMLSAARYPVVMFGSVHLPNILPQSAAMYAILRKTHTILAYLFLLTILGHLGAVLYHTIVLRDGLLKRMAPWRVRPEEIVGPETE